MACVASLGWARAACSLRLALLAAARPRALSTTAAAPNTTCERRVRVEVVADVVCPWCYIGLSRMQGALATAEAEGIAVDVTYTPFILRRLFSHCHTPGRLI